MRNIDCYSKERIRQISTAIAECFFSLPEPRYKAVAEKFGIAHMTIFRWMRADKTGKMPNALMMQSLWHKSGKNVFLLKKEEKELFRKYNKFIPHDFPDNEEPIRVEENTPDILHCARKFFLTERRKQIQMAICRWCQDTAVKKKLLKQLDVSHVALHKWQYKGNCPRPERVKKLFELTGDPAFRFTPEEEKMFKMRMIS